MPEPPAPAPLGERRLLALLIIPRLLLSMASSSSSSSGSAEPWIIDAHTCVRLPRFGAVACR
jgi:hypothetical protein